MRIYDKVALAVVSDDRLLLCRPFAYEALITPGGVREPNETDIECLQREIIEELGEEVSFDPGNTAYVGEAEDVAAGPTTARVHIRLYLADLQGTPKACSEIRELIWFGAADDLSVLSPIVRNKILPMLVTHGALSRAHVR